MKAKNALRTIAAISAISFFLMACPNPGPDPKPDPKLEGTVSIMRGAEDMADKMANAGDTLTASLGDGSASGLRYQWYRSDTTLDLLIPGADKNAYDPTDDDAGLYVFARVTRSGYTGHLDSASIEVAEGTFEPLSLTGTVLIFEVDVDLNLSSIPPITAESTPWGSAGTRDVYKFDEGADAPTLIGKIDAHGAFSGTIDAVPPPTARTDIVKYFAEDWMEEGMDGVTVTVSNPFASIFIADEGFFTDQLEGLIQGEITLTADTLMGIPISYALTMSAVEYWFVSHDVIVELPALSYDEEIELGTLPLTAELTMPATTLTLKRGWNRVFSSYTVTAPITAFAGGSITGAASMTTTIAAEPQWLLISDLGDNSGDGTLDAPTGLAFADGVLSWDPVDGADYYVITIMDGFTLMGDPIIVEEASYDLSEEDLTVGKEYFAAVSAHNNDGEESDPSDPFDFTF